MDERKYQENLERLQKIAKEKGLVFNEDRARAEKVIGLMTKNYINYGKYYCPCKQSHPLNIETDPLCPCLDMDEEIERDGHCHCKLFYKKR